ncbi:YrzI family small protein [Evansella sp. AB-rgal1]
MMVHLFFLTVTISKRKFTEKDINRAQQMRFSEQQQEKLQAKRAQYFRLM